LNHYVNLKVIVLWGSGGEEKGSGHAETKGPECDPSKEFHEREVN
jgi:hypothetical protein